MSPRFRASRRGVRASCLAGVAIALSMTAMSAGCSSKSTASDPPAAGASAAAPAASKDVKKVGRPKVDTSSRREHNRAKPAAQDAP